MTDHYLQSLLGDREQVLLIDRQHWFVFLRSIAFELLFAAIIVIAIIVLGTLVLPGVPVFFGLILLIIPLLGLLQDYLAWSRRMYIVTNLRVMQVAGVFNKNVTDSSLEKVNDVKMSQSFLGRIFDFGDIEILTASELGVNLFKMIGEPVKFKTTMLNAKENLELGTNHPVMRHSEPSLVGGSIPDLIGELQELRERGVLTEEEFQKKKAELLAKL